MGTDKKIAGVFDSKSAAISQAACVSAGPHYGTFEEAIEKTGYKKDYEFSYNPRNDSDHFTDNRREEPDNGLLLRMDKFGDTISLYIEKQSVVRGIHTNII